MQFSDSTNKTGIVEDTSFLLFGDSGDHSADYPLNDVARNANRWYDKVVSKILQVDTRWKFDDANQTDLPIADIDLVANQQDYGVATSTFLKISRIDIKDANGIGINLLPFDRSMLRGVAMAEFLKSAGTPKYYDILASSVFMYPKPSYSLTAGMRIFYQRNVLYFVGTDTTKVPGFATNFHRILSLGAAYEYAFVNGMSDKMKMIDLELYGDARKQKPGLFDELQEFYARRDEDLKLSMQASKTDYGEIALGQNSSSRYGNNTNNPKGFY